MLQKIRETVRRDNKSLLLAALFSGALFARNYPVVVAQPDLLVRQCAMTGLFFVLLYAIFRLFSSGVQYQVLRELGEAETANLGLLRTFVVYKEVVKTVVGVSLTLGWLAGLLFLVERFGHTSLLLPLLLGGLLSALLAAMATVFVVFVDHIRYPQDP